MPDDSPEAVNAYLNILRALFNLTNATHTNSSARSVTGQFFQQRKSLLATDSLTSTDGESKYTDNDNAEGIYQGGTAASRLRSLRRSLQQIAVDSGLMQAVPPSPPARAKEALDEFVRPAWNDYYTDETIRNDPQFGPYYAAASMSPLEAYHFYRQIKCEAEQKLMFFEIEAIIKDPNARTAWLLLNTDFGLADMLAGLGIIPCRDRTSEQRPALEIFPAPSPPPPLDDWVTSLRLEPPHTPAHAPTAHAHHTALAGRASVAAVPRLRGHRLLVVDGALGELLLCVLRLLRALRPRLRPRPRHEPHARHGTRARRRHGMDRRRRAVQGGRQPRALWSAPGRLPGAQQGVQHARAHGAQRQQQRQQQRRRRRWRRALHAGRRRALRGGRAGAEAARRRGGAAEFSPLGR